MWSLIKICPLVSEIIAKMSVWSTMTSYPLHTVPKNCTVSMFYKIQLTCKVWSESAFWFPRYEPKCPPGNTNDVISAKLGCQLTPFSTQSMGPKTKQTYKSLNKIGQIVSEIQAKMSGQTNRQTDRQTDKQTDIQLKLCGPPLSVEG